MNDTEAIPAHAFALLTFLRDHGPMMLDDTGIFDVWRVTGLSDLEIIAALDFLELTGFIERSTQRTLRCRVKMK